MCYIFDVIYPFFSSFEMCDMFTSFIPLTSNYNRRKKRKSNLRSCVTERLKMKRYCCFNFFSSSHHLSLTNYWTSCSVFVCIFFFFLSFVSFFRTAFHQRYDGALLLAVFLIASTNNLCKPFLPLGMMMMILIIFRKYTSIFYDSVSSSSVSKLAPCS